MTDPAVVPSTPSVALRDADAGDFKAICALNLAEVEHTSAMDAARLHHLHQLASYHKVACVDGQVVAFLLAMPDDAPYENENFAWFARRFPRFLYVDRIVVSSQARGLSLGSVLYRDLFDYARNNGITRIACEYNITPPNEPSRRFHDKFGFTQRGVQWVAGGTKQVSLQVAEL